MKLLLVHPGASWSTADVEAGLRYGLQYHGAQVLSYRLDQRIELAHKTLHALWRLKKKTAPGLAKPNVADVFYQAGVGALEMALRHQVQAVVVVSAMYLHPDVLTLMRRAGLRVTVLFTESPYDLDRELVVAPLVDGCWTNERSSVAALRAVNPRAGYLPHAWHPETHRPGPQPGDTDVRAHDVVFCGTGFRERLAWLSAVDWRGIDLGLYGMWQDVAPTDVLYPFVQDGPIDNTVTARLYRRAKVGLNLHRTSMGWGPDAPPIAHAESLNPRAYELAACGAFFLSDDRAEVAEVFGLLVPTFQTPLEATTLIHHWVANSAGRARVAAQLPAAVAEASWLHRAATVLGDLQSLLHQVAA